MKNFDVSATENIFKEFLKNVGLNTPNVVMMESYQSTDKISVGLRFDFTISQAHLISSNVPIVRYLRDIQEGILKSPLVEGELGVLQSQLRMAKAESDKLLEQIKELEKYKTHYELEAKLRHGEKKNV